MSGFCTNYCPLGFFNNSGKCENINIEIPTLKFTFEGSGNTYYDTINNIPAKININSNQRKLTDEPVSVYRRGIYFPGNSNLNIDLNQSKIFNNEFSVSIWVKPAKVSAVLFVKYNYDLTECFFKIEYGANGIKFTILINEIQFSYNPNLEFLLNKWNHISFTNSFLDKNHICAWVNYQEGESKSINEIPFIDSDGSICLLASDSEFLDDFIGFIYTFEIYAFPKRISSLISQSNCKSCEICLIDGTCIIF